MDDKDVVGLTNAMTDIVMDASYKELDDLGLEKGVHHERAKITYDEFLEIISSKKKSVIPGGSAANVVRSLAAVDVKTALLGTVGNDAYGRNYVKQLEECGVESCLSVQAGPSGVCYVFVTPDGERSSLGQLGVSGEYDLDFETIRKCKIFHTTGYEVMTNPEKTKEAITYAHQKGTLVSFDAADVGAVNAQKTNIEDIIKSADIVFVTEEEAQALLGSDPKNIFKDVACPFVILKKGKHGSVVQHRNKQYAIPIYPVRVVNTNGAGDSYAAGFLFGYLKGFSVEDCGHFGSFIASRVCGREEAFFSRRA